MCCYELVYDDGTIEDKANLVFTVYVEDDD